MFKTENSNASTALSQPYYMCIDEPFSLSMAIFLLFFLISTFLFACIVRTHIRILDKNVKEENGRRQNMN